MQLAHFGGLTCRAACVQFLTDPREATLIGLAILKQGGLAPGAQATLLIWHELVQCVSRPILYYRAAWRQARRQHNNLV